MGIYFLEHSVYVFIRLLFSANDCLQFHFVSLYAFDSFTGNCECVWGCGCRERVCEYIGVSVGHLACGGW